MKTFGFGRILRPSVDHWSFSNTKSENVVGVMSKEISLPRPLKDRLLLTGTAPLYQICCLEKLPILPNLIFPDSLLSFLLLSPFGGRGIVHFGYYLARQFGNYVTATVETNQAGRMVLRETE